MLLTFEDFRTDVTLLSGSGQGEAAEYKQTFHVKLCSLNHLRMKQDIFCF